MGMWQGIRNSMVEGRERKAQEEAQAKLDALNSENMRLKKLDMALQYSHKRAVNPYGSSTTTSTGGKDIPTVEHSLAELTAMDIPEDIILKVAGGGARDLDKLVKEFSKTVEKHKTEYGDIPMAPEMFINALQTAVITQPKKVGVNIDEVLELFKVEASEAERTMFPAPVAPRQRVTLRPGSLNVIPALKPEDLPKAIQAISTNVILSAAEELNNLKSVKGDETLQAVDPEINIWLANRIGQVEAALARAQGDIPILTDIFGLYGNSFASQYIESQPILKNAVKMGQFPEQYATAAARPDLDLSKNQLGESATPEYGKKILVYLLENKLVPLGTNVKFFDENNVLSVQTVTEDLLRRYGVN